MTNEEAIIKCEDYLSRYEKLRKREDFTKNDEENIEFALVVKSALENIDRITEERDMAIREIGRGCWNCSHNRTKYDDDKDCDLGGCAGGFRWEWRGVQKNV